MPVSNQHDLTRVHTQSVPSAEWVIVHSLGKFPSVTVIDSLGREVYPAIEHLSNMVVRITFNGETSGQVSFN